MPTIGTLSGFVTILTEVLVEDAQAKKDEHGREPDNRRLVGVELLEDTSARRGAGCAAALIR